MNTLTRRSLTEALEKLQKSDPLLNKGIAKDWVCVLHPSLVVHVQEAARQSGFADVSNLDWIMGRKVMLEGRAPTTMIEYMNQLTYATKYPQEITRDEEPRPDPVSLDPSWLHLGSTDHDSNDPTDARYNTHSHIRPATDENTQADPDS